MYHQRRMQQMGGGDRHSESLYFTPSGTPMRESNPEPPLSGKSTSFSNDSEAYSAVYYGQNQSNHSKTHNRVKSFSHFLPGWFNNTTKEVQVEVVVEQNKDDYNEVSSDSKTNTESPEEGLCYLLNFFMS